MLSPNALRVLDDLGVYSRIRTKGFNFETVTSMTDDHVPIGTYCFGSEAMYQYKAIRVYRQDILDELTGMVLARGIQIQYGKKFQHIISEDKDGVNAQFADGTSIRTPMLVGTDGIHSRVRQYIAPGSTPQYLGQLAICGAVPRPALRLPTPAYPLPASIFGKPGVFILAPQGSDGTSLLAGTQYAHPEMSREQHLAISASPPKMLAMLRRDEAAWSDLVQSAMQHVIPSSMYIWPFYAVPPLDAWTSAGKRVVVIGDAAHAIPPTLGQGANQAVEEALSLSILLRSGLGAEGFGWRMEGWQRHRKERIERLMRMTRKMNNNRLPVEMREKLSGEELWHADPERPGEEMRWLYGYRVEEEMERIEGLRPQPN